MKVEALCNAAGPSVIQNAKGWLTCHAGLSKDALHVYVGIAVLLLTAALLRRRVGTAWPLLAVAGVALLGEIADVADQFWWRDPVIRWGDSVHDLVNTLALPLLLTLAARWTRLLGGYGREQPLE